ncbi:MAG: flagellar biosynthesis protein FlgH [Glaciimonas sp.]|nr:flagellar biosynthesis protein FlgH [Glaciimonas sp.]
MARCGVKTLCQLRGATALYSIALAAIVSGCAVTPNSIVMQPTTAKPISPSILPQTNGAIFQNAAYRPLFEDRRARMIGDILTIVITEKTSAGKASANSSSKSGSTSFAAPLLFGGTAAVGLQASSANKLDGKGAETASNNFTGTLGVTVVDVLQNGNLVVSGEKQVAFDGGAEFVRFSGVVSPDIITAGNIVSSARVADARVEYRTNSQLDSAQMMSLLSRFFLSFIPL